MNRQNSEVATFGVGFNMAGFMPDMDPHSAPCLTEAKACLVESIQHFIDELNQQETDGTESSLVKESIQIARFQEAQDAVKEWSGPSTVTVNGWAFWICEY